MENHNNETRIQQCYLKMYDCMITKNIKELDELLDNSYVLIHMTGMTQTKNAFLRAIQNGTLNYYECKDTQFSISINGEKASLIGKSHVTAAVFGGGKNIWPLQLNIDLILKNGKWLMTKAQASTF